jgi:hypothetical protein
VLLSDTAFLDGSWESSLAMARDAHPLVARMVKILDLFEFNHGCGLNTLSQGKPPKQT